MDAPLRRAEDVVVPGHLSRVELRASAARPRILDPAVRGGRLDVLGKTWMHVLHPLLHPSPALGRSQRRDLLRAAAAQICAEDAAGPRLIACVIPDVHRIVGAAPARVAALEPEPPS